jgi:hypothetical protein
MYHSTKITIWHLICVPSGDASLMPSYWTAAIMPATPPASQLRTFHVDAPVTRVVPFFTALGERAWAKDWDPRILSGGTDRGSAFTTRGHTGQISTWIVTDYRPAEGRISYARVAHDSNIGLIDVICTGEPTGGTDVAVRYTLTALSDAGAGFVSQFMDDKHYEDMIEEWHVSVSEALARAPIRGDHPPE